MSITTDGWWHQWCPQKAEGHSTKNGTWKSSVGVINQQWPQEKFNWKSQNQMIISMIFLCLRAYPSISSQRLWDFKSSSQLQGHVAGDLCRSHLWDLQELSAEVFQAVQVLSVSLGHVGCAHHEAIISFRENMLCDDFEHVSLWLFISDIEWSTIKPSFEHTRQFKLVASHNHYSTLSQDVNLRHFTSIDNFPLIDRASALWIPLIFIRNHY